MATKLGLYNGALKIIGERRLASLTEEVEARRVLDDVYDDALAYCLEAGPWWFATRESQIAADASAPAFGFSARFAKPSDWVSTIALGADADFSTLLSDAVEHPGFWHANVDPIFVRYVSDDASYGMDLTLWPASFTLFVEYELAERIVEQLTASQQRLDVVMAKKSKAKLEALVAMRVPPRARDMNERLDAIIALETPRRKRDEDEE